MKITKDTVVSISFLVHDLNGTLLEASDEPANYLHGGYDNIFPVVEAELEGKAVGDKIDLKLQPADAFGDYDESLVRMEELSAFPEDLEIGMQFVGSPVDGGEELLYTVTDIADGKVIVDANHPYAGQAVRFEATVVGIRTAEAEEIAHGHVHGPDGHHHH